MKLIFFILLLSLFTVASGQFEEPKFGKIEIKDLEMSRYDKDTSAAALMLFDDGYSRFILNKFQGFQHVYERHFQVKIFKKSAFELANISIRLYHNGRSTEEIGGLKAVTYNLVNGKIEKTKLENKQIFRTEGTNYVTLKFAFPEVKEGSVIELTYSVSSDFLYNFRGWTFQYTYPVLWSMYTYEIPEYFRYSEYTKGYLQFDVNKRETKVTSYSLPVLSSAPSKLGRSEPTNPQILNVKTEKTSLGIKDVPAFISEPGIDCEYNYIQSLEFELSSVKFPNQPAQTFTQTWESVNEQLKKDDSFGGLLKTNGFIKDTVTAICNGKSTDLEKARAIYDYVSKRMEWNGIYSFISSKNLKKSYNDKVGNSAEINMLLIMMMQTAGLKANPVLLSTRDNGLALDYYPTISKFNSVLAKVEVGGKIFLIDAINKNYPFGVLPVNDVNGKGRVVDDQVGSWVNLDANEKYREEKTYDLNFNTDGKLSGNITETYSGYAGILFRNALDDEKSNDDFFRKRQEKSPGLEINKYSISGRLDNDKPVTDSLNVEIADHADIIGDKILFYPLLFERIEKNNYTLEERKYPVNFNYPISEVYRFDYTIPEGYIVESIPRSATINLPDNSISIKYTVRNIDNKIEVEYTRDINKILFLPTEYARLKSLYDQLVRKHAEQVILKKSA
jgi:hypothetical protein